MWEFPGGPMVRTQRFHCWGPGSVPGWGIKTLQVTWHGQKKTKKKTTLMNHKEKKQLNSQRNEINKTIYKRIENEDMKRCSITLIVKKYDFK